MARRARLNDENNPLSKSDNVLAGYEQASKSTSQQVNKSISQEADSESKSSTTKKAKTTRSTRKKATSQQANKLKSQKADKSTSQEDKLSTGQDTADEVNADSKSASQQVDKSRSQKASKVTSQEDRLSASSEVEFEKIKLRKSTFQINEEVLNELDKLHLTLQLEMGKGNAPYKEVIVEEALAQLLEKANSDNSGIIEGLLQRQRSRGRIG